MNSSRSWIATSGEKSRRITTLSFVLPDAARVVFTVVQTSPTCRTVGHFSVRGHAGRNEVRFAGRVGRRQLSAGTYRIIVRTRDGRSLQRVTIVVIDGRAPTKSTLAGLRAANVCSSRDFAAMSSDGAPGAPAPGRQVTDREKQPSPSKPSSPDTGGILGSATVETAAQAIRPAFLALLVAAILLLGIASLPPVAIPDARLNRALARHRIEIASLGATALAVVIVSLLLD